MSVRIMIRTSVKMLGFVMALLFVSVVAAQAPNDIDINVSLDRESIGPDEQAVLQVEISGPMQDLPNPTMPTLDKFEVYSQGRSSNISIVNGVVSSSVTYRYILIPQAPGTYPISGISITYNGKTYSGNAVTLTVTQQGVSPNKRLQEQATTPDGNGRDYFLEASVDQTNPYVGQQITLTLRFCVAVQFYGSPSLDEPSTTGFWTEVLGNRPPYFQKINNRTYRVIERTYALYPSQTGPLTIGRATITTTVAVRTRARDPFDMFGDFFGQGQQVQVRSDPLRVIAKPLPEQGKPANFSGSVGKYSILATPNKLEVDAGQPVTVTIRIEGSGNVKSVAEPQIPDLPDFRVYKASSNEQISKTGEGISGAKIIEEVFIPKRPGQLEIPSLSLDFFDPKKGTYQTVKTAPIKLTATKPEGFATSPDMPALPSGVTIGSQAQDIRFIKQDPGNLSPKGRLIISDPFYVGVNAIPVVLLAGTIFMRLRREKMAANVGWARGRSAGRQARKRLGRARSMASIEKANQFYAELSLVFTSYIADKLNVSPHGLTTEAIAEILQGISDNQELTQRVLSFLRQCDFARFAPATVTSDGIAASLKSAEDLMTQIEEVKLA